MKIVTREESDRVWRFLGALEYFAPLYITRVENERLTCCLKNMPFIKKIIGEKLSDLHQRYFKICQLPY